MITVVPYKPIHQPSNQEYNGLDMGAQRVLHLIKTGKIFSYSLGRFLTVRRTFSGVLGLLDAKPRASVQGKDTLFDAISIPTAVEQLRKDAFV